MSALDALEASLVRLAQSSTRLTPVSCSLSSVWWDARLLPAYAIILSFALLLYRAARPSHAKEVKPVVALSERPTNIHQRVTAFIRARGGWVVYAFNITRVFGTAALVGLSIASVALSSQKRNEEVSGTSQMPLGGEPPWDRMWDCTGRPEVGLLVGYTYAMVLSLAAVVLSGPVRAACSLHAAWLLFLQFLVFAWRNLLPLTLVHGTPADHALSWLLWTRCAFVTLVGFAIPVLVPQIYVPYDPAHPAAQPAPEQTASLFTFIFYIFVEPVVWTAWRRPSLPYELLPPLPDTDWSDNLRLRAMDKLDPIRRRELGKRDRHLFFGLMELFGYEQFMMAVYLIAQVFVGFMGPVGVNRLLTYMEHDPADALVHPWVWIAFIFLAPILNCFALSLYSFTGTRMGVQAESILTQLIFEHALRVRLTEEAPGSSTSGTATPSSSTDQAVDVAAAAPHDAMGSGTESETLVEAEERTVEAAEANDTKANAKDGETKTTMHLSGKINNLFGTDVGKIIAGKDWLVMVIDSPFEAIVCAFFLWTILDWAAVVGMLFIIVTLPVPMMIGGMMQGTQEKIMETKDRRVQAITESVSIIRMIKMFAWETLVTHQLIEKRNEEVRYLRWKKILNMINVEVTGMLPMITMILTYAFYTLVLHKQLDAARIFSSISVFDTLRGDMLSVIFMIGSVVDARVSMDRVTNFLRSSILLDKYQHHASQTIHATRSSGENDTVGFHNVTFTWTEKNGQPRLSGQRNFQLHLDHLVFKSGEINVIVGPTGCGKTSILMALLGEMHMELDGPDSWFSLPRDHGIAYAAQESWVQNDTIRANVLFESPYDEVRYKKVLYQCGLEPDLAMFAAGDEAEVGERGLTLSGGQKARITLARAVYSPAQILLLDDIVSALDVHTARWVVDKCLKGDLLAGRTVILVTHAVPLIASIATNVVSLSAHGQIISQGSMGTDVNLDPILRKELQSHSEEAVLAGGEKGEAPKEKNADGKLVLEEEMQEGRVNWATVRLLIDAFGGPVFWFWLIVGYIVCNGSEVLGTWWLGQWAAAYGTSAGHVNAVYYLLGYVVILFGMETAYSVMQLFHAVYSARACRYVHDLLLKSVFGSTLRWIDSTPVGRIIGRFTGSMSEFDDGLTSLIEIIVRMTISLVLRLGVVIYVTPVFGIPSALFLLMGLGLGQLYIHAQMSARRLRSTWRSPLFSHLGAAVSGLISVRAYGAEDSFKAELRKRADAYSRPTRTFQNLSKWISTRTDLLRATFLSALAAYLVYFKRDMGAGTIGFSLSIAMEFSMSILSWVRYYNMVELAANSLERMREYIEIEHEPALTKDHTPPAYWPSAGTIRVENLSARYSKDGPLVLQNVSFQIKSGERVGIVGRTGSGKSSLALALLRLIPTEGKVYLDDRLTEDTNLDALRTQLAIIPQEPTLISGTLRTNLDPFSQEDDATLYNAIKAVGLVTEAGGSDGTDITLDSTVANAGSNFSVGQRQLIALARAIIRRTRVLILDEATASVDAETDAIIQTTIRAELRQATLITIAHRLLTIMDYDKILVLDGGKVTEFDTPLALLRNKQSYFRSLVQNSGDSARLFAIAEKKAT